MKFLNYAYYRIYCWGVNISDDFLNEYKPGFLFANLEMFLFFDLYIWFISITKIDVELNTPLLIIVGAFIVLSNSYTFIYKKKWDKYSQEFENYSASKRTIWDILIVLIILGTIVFTVFSFNELSRINFKELSK